MGPIRAILSPRWICAGEILHQHFAVNLIVDVFHLKDDFAGTGSLLNLHLRAAHHFRKTLTALAAYQPSARGLGLRYGSGAL
ncbi:hypothetical protein MJ390_11205 [Klebsiella pneumoniae]|nr:hypothetical protein MJ390_11205 [Klebsiella pneumoniae]